MFKTVFQQGRSPKATPEAYPLGYVEDVVEARTLLEAVFNILLRYSQGLGRCLINTRSDPRKLTIGISLE
ncbi:MAG: hypothetical protein M3Z35_07245 [Nitrospirota bacterium]|nr:hypothetical protein [Nitrospirota bacterium]